MRQLSATGQQAIQKIAQRQGFSVDSTLGMLDAVINGNGSMAQFNHPDCSGSRQWMRGGMTMVSEVFNNHLSGRVDGLCSALPNLVANPPDLVRSGSVQSQSQGGGGCGQQQTSHNGQYTGQDAAQGGSALQGGNGFGPVNLFVPPASGTTGDWWPADPRWPNSSGSQDGVRYAHFSQARQRVIDIGGTVTLYDTLDHQIGGFSQQRSVGGTLSFNSQYRLMDMANLPVISSNGRPPMATAAPASQPPHNAPAPPPSPAFAPAPTGQGGREQDICGSIERLADLRAKGFLSDDEFSAKKAKLLSQL